MTLRNFLYLEHGGAGILVNVSHPALARPTPCTVTSSWFFKFLKSFVSTSSPNITEV